MAFALPRPSRADWSDAADGILGGDQAVVLAHLTPARGVVLTPVTNFGLRDRAAGTVAPVSSSVGMWRKLERIRAAPRVAVAFHTREHGFADRPEYVLVQGEATVTPYERRDWVDEHREAWERFAGPRDVGLWERWLRVYHWRSGVEIAVHRVVVWPDLRCEGPPVVHGAPLPADPPEPQRPPAKGTGPRIDHRRAARRAAALPDVLLGWAGADGFPVAVPVAVGDAAGDGIELTAAAGLVPPGGRRAGLTAHRFARHTFGQVQRKHTGWLEAGDGRLLYAPHTEAGHRLPESRFLYRMASGYVTRRGLREGRAAGVLPQ